MALDKTSLCTNCGTTMYQGGNPDFPTDMVCGKCGKDHDSIGRPLAPRSQWDEETDLIMQQVGY